MSPLLSPVSPNESNCGGTGNSVTGTKKKTKTKQNTKGQNIFHVFPFLLFSNNVKLTFWVYKEKQDWLKRMQSDLSFIS